MKQLFLYFVIVLLHCSCGDKSELRTKKIIGKKPLLTSRAVANIATQLHLIAAANSSQLLADSSKSASLVAYQKIVFDNYKTTTKNYTYAYNYYGLNADTLLWIHDEIITQLSLLQAKEAK